MVAYYICMHPIVPSAAWVLTAQCLICPPYYGDDRKIAGTARHRNKMSGRHLVLSLRSDSELFLGSIVFLSNL